MNQDEIEEAVKAERLRLCDFLDDLDDAEWNTQSLCSAWNVREVVAHLTIPTRATIRFLATSAVKARGDFNRMVTDTARDRAAKFAVPDLIQQLRDSAGSSRRIPGSGPMDPLMDLVVHGLDIARPLNRSHPVRMSLAVPVLSYVAANRLLGAPGRLTGLELIATDADWSAGQGAQVRGSATDLLLVAAGRPAGLTSLTGPGVNQLSDRFASR